MANNFRVSLFSHEILTCVVIENVPNKKKKMRAALTLTLTTKS